mmetsp:Transcript_13963/g.15429  ORF Transcript_13963/g.15429 Transcript_13963/m.15429 type:complete len:575 (+) Transcript_13963:1-1725(+)
MRIRIPANAIVGQYTMKITFEGEEPIAYPHPVIVLFNPWSEKDDVYIRNDRDRTEYVTNYEGAIWKGSALLATRLAWDYAIYEEKSLLACLQLVTMLPLDTRSDAVLFSRALSALVNSQDEGGILVGNWSGNYEGGEKPSSWTGSGPILEQFYVTENPVKYGQCWVFACVLCSVCRILGIPCRSLTNFNSAHDTSFDRGIELYFYRDDDGELIKDHAVTSDSIWNFHCWNEVWLARRDLPPGYGGWQALDSTPQELSGGIYQTGPCPVSAIKAGSKSKAIKYDLDFIYAEVNADIKHFARDEESGEYELIKVNTKHVGAEIVTKAVNSMLKRYITGGYKHFEGTAAERAVHQAPSEALKLEMSVEPEQARVGDDFEVTITVTRLKGAGYTPDRNASLMFVAYALFYTGEPRDKFKSKTVRKFTVLGSGEPAEFKIKISQRNYLPLLDDDHYMKFSSYVLIDDTKETAINELNYDLLDPEVNMDVDGDLKEGEEKVVKVSFKNPISKDLTDMTLHVEGAGLIHREKFKIGTLASGATMEQDVTIKGLHTGNHILVATINCNELAPIHGEQDVSVI